MACRCQRHEKSPTRSATPCTPDQPRRGTSTKRASPAATVARQSNPLSPEHLQQLSDAKRRAKKVRRAASVAALSGWSMLVFDVATIAVFLVHPLVSWHDGVQAATGGWRSGTAPPSAPAAAAPRRGKSSLWAALTLGALLPGALLLAVRAAVGERLLLSVPLLVVGVAATVRLAFYLLPQATVALAPWLVGAALAWGLGFTLRALRRKTLAELLGAALVARAGTVVLGLLGATQAGTQAALLQLFHHALAATLLALPTAAGSERRPRLVTHLIAALLILDVPGMLGFVQRTLLVLGIFPGLRVAAGVTTLASFLLAWAALRLTGWRPAAPRRPPAPDPWELALAAGLTALATGLGLWTQPLLDLSRGFVSDFISHVFTHLDASTVALLVR